MTGLCSATYVCRQHGSAHIHPPHADAYSNRSLSLAPSGPCRAHCIKPAAVGLLLYLHAGTDRQMDTMLFHTLCFAYYDRIVWLQFLMVNWLVTGNIKSCLKLVSLKSYSFSKRSDFVCNDNKELE